MDNPILSQDKAAFPVDRQPFLKYDPITGYYYDPADYPEPQQEYMVIDLPDSLGISHNLYATFPTKKEAQQWQLANGKRATTRIIGWPDD